MRLLHVKVLLDAGSPKLGPHFFKKTHTGLALEAECRCNSF